MALKERLQADLLNSLKSGDAERASVLRLAISQVKNREIEKQGKEGSGDLSDGEVQEVLQKELKKRRESIELFRKGNREDLAKKEEFEMKVVEEYLPPPVT